MGTCILGSPSSQLPTWNPKADCLSSFRGSSILQSIPNLSIDDFIIDRVLGKGEHGKVYYVTKEDTRQSFAMKSFRVEQGIYQAALDLESFSSEINECPFILPIRHIITVNDKLYTLTDYTSAGKLFTYVDGNNQLSEASAKVYLAELAIALEYLHSRGFVHHGLKPDDLLLDNDGHLMLSSFGISKNTIQFSKTSRENARPEYEVPKDLRGKPSGDCWSLVRFSQGVIMFEMMTGETLFDKELNARADLAGTLPLHISQLIQELVFSECSSKGSKASIIGELMRSSFFQGTDWRQVRFRQLSPPIKPSTPKDQLGDTDITLGIVETECKIEFINS